MHTNNAASEIDTVLPPKPSPENQKSGGDKLNGRQAPHLPPKQRNQKVGVANRPTVPSTIDASTEEIRGTDTPPEKVPRQRFPSNLAAHADDISRPSLFSSIKHKFSKVDNGEKSCD
ncbi:unnamed protein product, partial [Ilex paraguariensis]